MKLIVIILVILIILAYFGGRKNAKREIERKYRLVVVLNEGLEKIKKIKGYKNFNSIKFRIGKNYTIEFDDVATLEYYLEETCKELLEIYEPVDDFDRVFGENQERIDVLIKIIHSIRRDRWFNHQ